MCCRQIPLSWYPAKRTSMRSAGTSLMGQERASPPVRSLIHLSPSKEPARAPPHVTIWCTLRSGAVFPLFQAQSDLIYPRLAQLSVGGKTMERGAVSVTNDNRVLQTAFFLCVISAISGSLLASDRHGAWQWLHYLTKPTATALLIILVYRNASTKVYGRTIAAGLAFAFAGDFFLMLPGDYFLQGLVCFLLTHCAYIYALTRDARPAGRCPIFAGFAAVALLMVAGLWNALPDVMRLPVAIYAAALAFMAAQAASRASEMPPGTPARATARLAAIGGVFFLISDTILAYGRFRWIIPGQSLWVLSFYYVAQWLFARSTYAISRAKTCQTPSNLEDRVANRTV